MPSQSVNERLSDAGELHRKGYTRRAVHARWVLEAHAILNKLLTDDGEPLQDTGTFDASHYMGEAAWREVVEAAQTICNCARSVAVSLMLGEDG